MSFSVDRHQIMKALGKSSTFDSVRKGSTNGNQRKSVSKKFCEIVFLICYAVYNTTFTFNVYFNVYIYIYRWILACYDIDILDYETIRAVVDTAPLNEGVDILEFDYSRKEIEVCRECACMCIQTILALYYILVLICDRHEITNYGRTIIIM